MDVINIAFNGLITFLGAVGGSWIVLSQHKQKAWWESKRNVYTELIEALLVCVRRSSRLANVSYHFDESQTRIAPPDDDEPESEAFSKALKRIREISLAGKYFVGPDAAQLLKDCVYEYDGTEFVQGPPFEQWQEAWEIFTRYLPQLVEAAQCDLHTWPKVKRWWLDQSAW